ncbi:MAG: 50S ribosomal protein L3 [candidate division Zixibacteria bacterium]|nr:50S ribosomal protein L3 [candidate division Zixibacteria bacterium]
MKEILGKKLGMTRIFNEAGESVPCTVIEAGPCAVVSRCTVERNGYEAYQVTFGKVVRPHRKVEGRRRVRSHLTKPMAGVFAKAGVEARSYLRELHYDEAELAVGAELKVNVFREGERVDVIGVSRGLGFAGSMKRHNFGGGEKTHGQSDRWRAPGSIGSSSYPSRVFKGQRMAKRMGREQVTVLDLSVVKIIEDENLMLIRGSVPGFNGSLVRIRQSNRSQDGR